MRPQTRAKLRSPIDRKMGAKKRLRNFHPYLKTLFKDQLVGLTAPPFFHILSLTSHLLLSPNKSNELRTAYCKAIVQLSFVCRRPK